MITVDTVTDEQIRALRDEARAVVNACRTDGEDAGDMEERIRACNAALGLPTGDGALGTLDQRACRERVAKIIADEGTARAYGLLTAETITDDQIRELNLEPNTVEAADRHVALFGSGGARRDARARCAELLNARENADRGVAPEAK